MKSKSNKTGKKTNLIITELDDGHSLEISCFALGDTVTLNFDLLT